MDSDNLRQRAEELITPEILENIEELSQDDIKRLIHDLRVHQVELEIQNEELRLTQQNLLDSQYKLQKSYDHFSHLYYQAPIGYATVNASGIIVQANYTLADMIGVSNDYLEGKSFFNIIDSEDQKIFRSRFKSFISQPNEKKIEVNLKRIDNSIIYVLIEGRKVDWQMFLSKYQSSDLTLIIIHDITDRKEAENKLLEAKLLAERASRAKSDFLGRMSHELRTPMNAILGFAQLLEHDHKSLTSEQFEGVSYILKSGYHLLKLIEDILDIAKVESGEIAVNISEVHLNNLIKESILLTSSYRRNYNVTIHNEINQEYWVFADPSRLKQVIINLLSNAIKYNRREGDVFIRAESFNNQIIITVADTGIGIIQDQLNEIFEPFHRLEQNLEVVEGTGIGLYITKKLMSTMNGEIHVKSNIGQGSQFSIHLPSSQAPAISHNIQEKNTLDLSIIKNQHQSKIKILYVEDNPANLKFMKNLLKRIPNIDSYYANNGEEGLEIIKEIIPHLIFLDIKLPQMDGFEVFQKLKSQNATKHIPVIAISADTIPENIQKAKEYGFKDFLTKPVRLEDITNSIHEIQSIISDAIN